jgi:hypothetical protein
MRGRIDGFVELMAAAEHEVPRLYKTELQIYTGNNANPRAIQFKRRVPAGGPNEN